MPLPYPGSSAQLQAYSFIKDSKAAAPTREESGVCKQDLSTLIKFMPEMSDGLRAKRKQVREGTISEAGGLVKGRGRGEEGGKGAGQLTWTCNSSLRQGGRGGGGLRSKFEAFKL